MPANTGKAGAIHRVACFAGVPAPTSIVLASDLARPLVGAAVRRSDSPGNCTKARHRSLKRHPNEAAFERMTKRLNANPDMMLRRKSTVEHPFRNLKQWALGTGRFLLRQLQGAKAEMTLAVTSYNLKRTINILGTRRLLEMLA